MSIKGKYVMASEKARANREMRRRERQAIKDEARRVYQEERKQVKRERALARARERARRPTLGDQFKAGARKYGKQAVRRANPYRRRRTYRPKYRKTRKKTYHRKKKRKTTRRRRRSPPSIWS